MGIATACGLARSALADCEQFGITASTNDAALSSLSRCNCDSALLRNAYSCEFLGNTSCLFIPGTLSSVHGYGTCSEFAGAIGTGLVSFSRVS